MATNLIPRFTIIDGPSLDGMLNSLKLSEGPYRRPVQFTFLDEERGEKTTITAQIESIGREDGTGESFFLKLQLVDKNVHLKGYYNSRTRKGWIEYC